MSGARSLVLVDGGGSGTRAALVFDGAIVTRNQGPPCDGQSLGPVGAAEVLVRQLDALWESAPFVGDRPDLTCLAVSAGSTRAAVTELGYELASGRDLCLPLCARTCWVVNDIVPLVTTAPIGVVCGTGTGYLARGDGGRWARASGLEYLLADEGGGFDLGLRGLRSVVRDHDGRGQPTLLTTLAEEWQSCSPEVLYERIYDGADQKPLIASFAPLVLSAAQRGDPVAEKIVADAALELAGGIEAVADRAGIADDAEVVLSGSLLLSKVPVLREDLAEELVRRGRSFRLRAAPRDPLVCVEALALRLEREPEFLTGFELGCRLSTWIGSS